MIQLLITLNKHALLSCNIPFLCVPDPGLLKHEVLCLSQSVKICLCEPLENTHSQEMAEVFQVNSSHVIHCVSLFIVFPVRTVQ